MSLPERYTVATRVAVGLPANPVPTTAPTGQMWVVQTAVQTAKYAEYAKGKTVERIEGFTRCRNRSNAFLVSRGSRISRFHLLFQPSRIKADGSSCKVRQGNRGPGKSGTNRLFRWAHLDTRTTPAGDSLSPRRRSGERVRPGVFTGRLFNRVLRVGQVRVLF